MEIEFGRLLDLRSAPSKCGVWTFVPSLVEFDGLEACCEFAANSASDGLNYPSGADAAFVRARLPRIFAYTPAYEDANEKCLLWEGFVGVQDDSVVGIPFVLSDHYGSCRLYFSNEGPDSEIRESIADDFWTLIAKEPDELEDFEQTVCHHGAGVKLHFSCKSGDLYCQEEE